MPDTTPTASDAATTPDRERGRAHAMARGLMDQHGLGDWALEWGHAKRVWGQCIASSRVIRLSWPLTQLNSSEDLRRTVLHEIAHAQVGPGEGHSAAWRAACRRLGIEPSRCYDTTEVTLPRPTWAGTCPTCGHTIHRLRLAASMRTASCGRCDTAHNPAHRLVWRRLDPTGDTANSD